MSGSLAMSDTGGGLPTPPPGGMPPSPGLPAGMAPPRPNLPVTQQQASPGNIGAAMLDVRNALEMLQRALPNVPMGAPAWKEVYDCIGKLSKVAGEQLPVGPMNQAALSIVRERSQNPMAAQLASMMGSSPNSPPAMPAPAA